MKLTFKHTVYASYIGYITQAIVNNFAPLLFIIFRDSLGIDLSKITLIITANFVIQLLVDLLSAKFVDKIGYRICIVTAHILSALGLVLMGILPVLMNNALAGLIISAAIYAVGGGLIEVLISPIVEACPTENKASSMSLLHSFYCWGSVVVILFSTLFLQAFGKENWRILSYLWALIPIFNVILFSKVPINTLSQSNENSSIKEMFSHKKLIIFAIIMLCAGASELSMSQWASALAETGLGVSKTIGDLAGPCMFAILMGTSRVINSKLTQRYSISKLIIISGIFCVISYCMTIFSPWALLSLIGCGLCGFSVGIMWPGAFSMASSHFKNANTTLFALLALAGDLGCTIGPTVVGEISGAASNDIKTGLLFSIPFPLILILCCLILNKNNKVNSKHIKA